MQWTAQEYDLFRLEKEQGLDWKKIDSLRAFAIHWTALSTWPN